MAKRARTDSDVTIQQAKRARRDDASNEKMISKARYGSKGHYCPEILPVLEKSRELNNGNVPSSISLYTSPFPHQTEWSMDNLPEILFFIKPRPIERDSSRCMKLRDDNVNILDSAVVPDYVSVSIPEWLIGAWLRLDPTLNLSHIRARMCDDENFIGGKIEKPAHSALNNRLYRKCAKVFCHWDSTSQNKNQQDIRKRLSQRNIELNTILDEKIVAGETRLVKKIMKVKGNGTTSVCLMNVEVTEDNYLKTTFPIDHFKINGEVHPTPALTDGSTPPSASEEEAATPAPVLAPTAAPLFVPVPSAVMAPVDFTGDNDAFIKRLDKAMEETQALLAFEPLEWGEIAAVPAQGTENEDNYATTADNAIEALAPQAAIEGDKIEDFFNFDGYDDAVSALAAPAAIEGDAIGDLFNFDEYDNAVPGPPAPATTERNEFDDLLDEIEQDIGIYAAEPSAPDFLSLPPMLPSESLSSSPPASKAPASFFGCDLDFGLGADAILRAI